MGNPIGKMNVHGQQFQEEIGDFAAGMLGEVTHTSGEDELETAMDREAQLIRNSPNLSDAKKKRLLRELRWAKEDLNSAGEGEYERAYNNAVDTLQEVMKKRNAGSTRGSGSSKSTDLGAAASETAGGAARPRHTPKPPVDHLENIGEAIAEATSAGSEPAKSTGSDQGLRDLLEKLEGVIEDILSKLEGCSHEGKTESSAKSDGTDHTSGTDATDGTSASDSTLGDLGAISDGEQATFAAKLEESAEAAGDYLVSDEVSDLELMEISRRNPGKFAEVMEKMSPGERMQVQQAFKRANRMMSMMSNMISANHKTSKAVVNNIRV